MKKGIDYPGVSVTFLCHDGEGNYVFSKRGENSRDERGRWDCGGGSVDLNDTVEGTLEKEIREELCTDILAYEFLGYRDVHREEDGIKTHWVSLDFKVLVDRSKVKNGEPHKLDEIAWFTLDKLPTPLHSQLMFTIEKYITRL